MLVAKKAAVIDRLSDGRRTLGVSLGSRPDDYQVFGATLEHRVTRFRHQVATLRRVWAEARHSDREHGVLGSPPVQDPGPPIWILGALTERARQRAVELGDGFVFGGAARPPTIGPAIQSMRPQATERGKPAFSFNAVAYVAIGGEPEFAEAVAHHRRYYSVLPVPAQQAILHGPNRQDRGRRRRVRGHWPGPAGADAIGASSWLSNPQSHQLSLSRMAK